MYKNLKFQLRSVEDILRDLTKTADIFPGSRNIFIADSDSLVHKQIGKIMDLISSTLPRTGRITSYARAHTLFKKDLQILRNLRSSGLTRLHIGLESGDISILNKICKGASPDTFIEGVNKAKKAGFEICFYVLCGIGGETLWQQHALQTARVIDAVNPDFVRLRTLSLVPNTPLFKSWKGGEFNPITPVSRLRETAKMVEHLDQFTGQLLSDHLTNQLWSKNGVVFSGINGKFPRDKEQILKKLALTIDEISERTDIFDAHTLVQRGVIRNL